VMAVMSSDGTTVEKIKYDPYGEATVALQDGQSATGNPYLFQGRRWDDEVDLYYFRNRVYSPALGRFLQRDVPSLAIAFSATHGRGTDVGTAWLDRGYPQSGSGVGYREAYSLYEFCRANALAAIDPAGRKCSFVGVRSVKWWVEGVALTGMGTGASGAGGWPLCVYRGLALIQWRCCCPGWRQARTITIGQTVFYLWHLTGPQHFFPADRSVSIPNPLTGLPGVSIGFGFQNSKDEGEARAECARVTPSGLPGEAWVLWPFRCSDEKQEERRRADDL